MIMKYQFIPPYARQGKGFEYISQSYEASPPAAYIISSDRKTFVLGVLKVPLHDSPDGHYGYNVLVDGNDTQLFASHIEKRNNRVRIFTRNGWLYWNGKHFN